MKLLFQEQTIEFDQTPSTEEVIEKINELLQDQFYFSHLLVDGEEVTEEPEVFLTKNFSAINVLEVAAIGAKEFINDLLLSGEEYSVRAAANIATLVDEFYNNPSQNSWTELASLFEGLQWMLSMVDTVNQSVSRPANWDAMVAHTSVLQEELGNLEEALENTDTVLIADMMQYEILPAFEALSSDLKITIDTEGMRHDLS